MAFMVPVMKSQWAVPETKNGTVGAGGDSSSRTGRRPVRRSSMPNFGDANRLRSRSRSRKISESAKSDLVVYATGGVLGPSQLVASKPSFGRFNTNSSIGSGTVNHNKKTRSVPTNIVQFAAGNSSSQSSITTATTFGARKMSRAATTGTSTSPFAAAVAVRRRFSATLVDGPVKPSMPTLTATTTTSKQPEKQSKTLSRRLLDKLKKWKRSSPSSSSAAAAASATLATSSSTSLLSSSSSSTVTTPTTIDK